MAAAAIAALGVGGALAGNGDDCPPNPEPGRCYEKVLVPEQYESFAEQVLVTPGRTGTRVVPAVYGEEVRQELVRAERTETITVPATWRTVTETVVVRPAGWRTETIPALYETVTERVLVRAAHMEWRRAVLVSQRPADPRYTQVLPTGEVLCYVEVPAEYGLTTRQVLRTPARTVRVETPAETRTVTREVIDRPAHTERRLVPAEYRSVRIRVLVTPERTESYDILPVYRTVMNRRLVRQASYAWREIQCAYGSAATGYSSMAPSSYGYGAPGTPYGVTGEPAADIRVLTSPNLVRAVQAALAREGYYRGPTSGDANAATKAGLARFQRDRRLAPGWNTQTLHALGVPYPWGAPL